MNIQEAITKIESLKPHSYSNETIVKWLSTLDGIIYNEIIRWHEGDDTAAPKAYSQADDFETELLVPEPYTEIYLLYLAAQIDFHNGEFSRYNNSMMMYNTALSEYADYYNRIHMPKQDNYISI